MFMLVSWFGLTLPLLNAADWFRCIRLLKRLFVSSQLSEVMYVWCYCWRYCFCSCWWRFFFSSRRRHTRSKRDWSSDVCSSDLAALAQGLSPVGLSGQVSGSDPIELDGVPVARLRREIGRASCRERL